jgi:hypothetical protein
MLFYSLPLIILLIDKWNVGACNIEDIEGISSSHIPMQSNSFFSGFDDVHIVPFWDISQSLACVLAVTALPTIPIYYINISIQLYLIIIIIMRWFCFCIKQVITKTTD